MTGFNLNDNFDIPLNANILTVKIRFSKDGQDDVVEERQFPVNSSAVTLIISPDEDGNGIAKPNVDTIEAALFSGDNENDSYVWTVEFPPMFETE